MILLFRRSEFLYLIILHISKCITETLQEVKFCSYLFVNNKNFAFHRHKNDYQANSLGVRHIPHFMHANASIWYATASDGHAVTTDKYATPNGNATVTDGDSPSTTHGNGNGIWRTNDDDRP